MEAVLFKNFVTDQSLYLPLGKSKVSLAVSSDEYLGGLIDCCGEVQRYAVIAATKLNRVEVERSREYVDYVMGRVILFDLRNGWLRKKSDSLKWILKRLEEVLFDMSVGGRLKEQEEAPQADQSQVQSE